MVPALFYGAITGIITGAVIWGYQFLAEEVLSASTKIYTFVTKNLAFLPLLIAGLLIAGMLSYYNTKLAPEAKGGGVPYIEGAARGILPLKWYRAVPTAMFGSFLSFFCGLPLGSEGPSVLIGGALGSGVNSLGGKHDRKREAWSRLAITGGARAGFATALNAPLAGILFALEECHKKFSPVVLLISSVSVMFAMITSGLLRHFTGMGEHALYPFQVVGFEVPELYLTLIAGIVAGIAAVIFSLLLCKFAPYLRKIKIHSMVKIMIAFLLSGIACLLCTDLIGGGAELIRKVGSMDIEWQIIIVLLIVKIVLLIVCVSSQVSGGMFIPFMCIGALVGGLMAKLMLLCGMNEAYYTTIVAITMCAFLGAVLKAPITAVVLVVELTGGAASFLVSLLAVVSAYLVTELCHTKAIYDAMLENIIKTRREGREVRTIKIEVVVAEGSYAVGKVLRDILFPSIVTTVVHVNASDGNADPELYVRGERIIRAGDTIEIEAQTAYEDTLRAELGAIFDAQVEPHMTKDKAK